MTIKFPWFAFVTGFYFATLQFCFLILLQVNISSTYLTYMAVVVSWFAGSVAGLWISTLNAGAGILLGIAGFYTVWFLLVNQPFSDLALAVSVCGIFLSGVWAGRFFVVLYSRFGRADRMFFHENNGFIFGLVLFFVGFTLLGKVYIFWAPVLSGGFLLLIRNRVREEGPGPHPA